MSLKLIKEIENVPLELKFTLQYYHNISQFTARQIKIRINILLAECKCKRVCASGSTPGVYKI